MDCGVERDEGEGAGEGIEAEKRVQEKGRKGKVRRARENERGGGVERKEGGSRRELRERGGRERAEDWVGGGAGQHWLPVDGFVGQPRGRVDLVDHQAALIGAHPSR